MVPNGVLIVDLSTGEITYSNKEMADLVGQLEGTTLKDKICSFLMYNMDQGQAADRNGSQFINSDESCSSNSFRPNLNLWDYLITLH